MMSFSATMSDLRLNTSPTFLSASRHGSQQHEYEAITPTQARPSFPYSPSEGPVSNNAQSGGIIVESNNLKTGTSRQSVFESFAPYVLSKTPSAIDTNTGEPLSLSAPPTSRRPAFNSVLDIQGPSAVATPQHFDRFPQQQPQHPQSARPQLGQSSHHATPSEYHQIQQQTSLTNDAGHGENSHIHYGQASFATPGLQHDTGFSSASDDNSASGPLTPASRLSPVPLEGSGMAASQESSLAAAAAASAAYYGAYDASVYNPASYAAAAAYSQYAQQYYYASLTSEQQQAYASYMDPIYATQAAAYASGIPAMEAYSHPMYASAGYRTTSLSSDASGASSPEASFSSSGEERALRKKRPISMPSATLMTRSTSNGSKVSDSGKTRSRQRRRSLSSGSDKEKRFVCSYPGCTRAFTRNFNLSTHYNTHLGIKPFACDHCDKSFSRRHDLGRHITAVHTPSDAVKQEGDRKEPCTCGGASVDNETFVAPGMDVDAGNELAQHLCIS